MSKKQTSVSGASRFAPGLSKAAIALTPGGVPVRNSFLSSEGE